MQKTNTNNALNQQERFDKRLQTSTITSDVVDYVVDKIASGVDPLQIIVFGSLARNTNTATSDLDMLVVHDGQIPSRQLRRQIERLLLGRRFGVDLLVRSTDEVKRNVADGNPFYTKHILRDGKVLYERTAESAR